MKTSKYPIHQQWLAILILLCAQAASAAGANPDQTDPQALPIPDAKPAAVHFELKQVIFSDSAFLGKDELAGIAAAYTGRQVGLDDINQLVSDVNALYARKKIMTGLAVLSGGQIIDGQIHIHLDEARYGQAQVKSGYTSADYILAQLHFKSGDIVDLAQMDQRMSGFNRSHEIQLGAEINPGSAAGFTDLVINTQEPDQYQLKLFADNQNAPSLGRDEAGVDAAVAGLLGRGDLLTLMLSKSSGATNINAGYGVGVGADGTTLNTALSKNNIAIQSGSYSKIAITGITDKATLGVNQPLLSDQEWLLATDFNYFKSIAKNYSAGVLLSKFDINGCSADFSANRRTELYQWSSLLQVDYGRAVDQSDTRSDYVLYSGNGNGMLPLFGDVYGTIRANGQFSKASRVPSSALFQIGGPATVRGYDTGFATGVDGYALSTELHDTLGAGFDVFGFVDHGQVGSAMTAKTKITGLGLGVGWTWKTLVAKLTYGHAEQLVHPDQSKGRVDFRIEGRIF